MILSALGCRVTYVADISCRRHSLSLDCFWVIQLGVLSTVNLEPELDVMEYLPKPSLMSSCELAHPGHLTVTRLGWKLPAKIRSSPAGSL